MKLLFVDDHTLLRQSVASQLITSGRDIVIDEAGDTETALRLLDKESYNLVLTDLALAGEDGLDIVKAAVNASPKVPCLILSMHGELERILSAIRAGASGYVTKSSNIACLLSAVHTIVEGQYYFDQVALCAMVRQLVGTHGTTGCSSDNDMDDRFSSYSSLTEREQELFRLLAENISIENIAQQLSISAKTVENHRANIYAKLGISDRLSLFHYARELGLVG